MKSRILFLTILMVWIFQSIFSQLFVELERNACKEDFNRVKNSIPHKQVLSFIFTDDNPINWEKTGHEFKADGKLYDVLSICKSASGMIVNCVSDRKEDRILVAYTKHKTETQNNREKFNFKIKIQGIKYYPSGNSTAFLCQSGIVNLMRLNKPNTSPIFREVLSPPPEGC